MTPLRPRRLAHRGVVSAAGLLLAGEPGSPSERLRRAFALAADGAVLRRLPGDLWLARLPTPRSWVAERAPGVPLVALDEGHLSAVPLTAAEREQIVSSLGPSVLWVSGGTLHQTPIATCPEIDLADCLALPELEVVELGPLLDPTPQIRPPEPAKSVREALGDDVAPADPEQENFLDSLRGVSGPDDGGGGDLLGWLREVGRAGREVLRELGAALSGIGRPGGSGPPAEAAPTSPRRAPLSRLERVWNTLRWQLARLSFRTPLGSLLTRRQARYMADMLRRFHSGDLLEALRYAVPLGAGDLLSEPPPPRLGGLGPRDDLSLQHRPERARSSLLFGPELYGELAETYRAAAERLQSQGRDKEAAFVYAELLHDPLAAVTLLEKAGFLREAAEIAEGHELSAGLVVRQWFLARDTERAIAHALTHDAFADAVRRLARSHPEEAAGLRLVWGHRLAEAGDWLGAVEAIWPVERARPLADTWAERVIAAGGLTGAQMLARTVRSGHRPLGELDPAVGRLLDEDGEGGARARTAFAEDLVRKHGYRHRAARYASATLRQVLLDAADGWPPPERGTHDELKKLAPDKILGADLPPFQQFADLHRHRDAPLLELRWPVDDRGTLDIHDLGVVSGGGYLFALGESGLRLARPDGRTRLHAETPAHRLVMADSRQRALAVAHRGHLARIARVDLLAGRVEPWTDLALQGHADGYDGQRFFVLQEQTLLCLDAQQTSPRAVWTVTHDDFARARLVHRPGRLWVVTPVPPRMHGENERSGEIWEYELPSLTLRHRTRYPLPDPDHPSDHVLAPARQGRYYELVSPYESDVAVLRGAGLDVELPFYEVAAIELVNVGRWVWVETRNIDGAGLHALSLEDGRRVFTLDAEGASRLSTQIDGDRLVVADDLGRLAEVDLERGRLLRDLRLFR